MPGNISLFFITAPLPGKAPGGAFVLFFWFVYLSYDGEGIYALTGVVVREC